VHLQKRHAAHFAPHDFTFGFAFGFAFGPIWRKGRAISSAARESAPTQVRGLQRYMGFSRA
ncbi:MAG TPA: hypothetical protein VGO70_09320, partial [Arsenicitalea sp.]|nr:hypothetical protein [Arsenicitalea sp.]